MNRNPQPHSIGAGHLRLMVAVVAVLGMTAANATTKVEKQAKTTASQKATGQQAKAAQNVPPAKSVPTGEQDFIDQGVLESNDLMEGGLEIGGLLNDDMVSKFGHELFDVFNKYWKPPEGASYNLTFSELTDPLRGSMATIRLNDQVIFEGPLSPREDAINDLGKALARDIRNLIRSNAKLEDEEYY
jgi:hypothetical protein